jgi:hypothetical protein
MNKREQNDDRQRDAQHPQQYSSSHDPSLLSTPIRQMADIELLIATAALGREDTVYFEQRHARTLPNIRGQNED